MREKILTFIEKNSRINLKELAIMLGVDEASVANEIAAMEQENVICGYHTLIDWHEQTYKTDFPAYLDYLNKSIEILCTHYGKVGGFWFDGFWDKPDCDYWQFDRLYGTIRKYQPTAMIINNTGLNAMGQVSHKTA